MKSKLLKKVRKELFIKEEDCFGTKMLRISSKGKWEVSCDTVMYSEDNAKELLVAEQIAMARALNQKGGSRWGRLLSFFGL